jgi:septal ring factor EnvC (AmiA/AmiB activator)
VEVVSRQAGPPVAWLKNWEHELLRSVAANLTREVPTAVGSAPTETYSTTGQYPAPSVYERSTTSTLNQSTTSDRIAQEQRRLEEVRQEQEQRREELAREQDQERRQKLNDEIERLRGELRTIETRLSDLETEQKQLK